MPRKKGVTQEDNMKRIAQAAVELIVDLGPSAATSSKIAQAAGVNRSTYYRNFASREDAIRYWYRLLIERSLPSAIAVDNMKDYLDAVFEGFYKNKRQLLALHRHRLSYLLLDSLNRLFHTTQEKEPDITRRLALHYHTGGIFNSLTLWFDTDMAMTASEFAAACQSILVDTAKPVLPRIKAQRR